MSRLRRTIKQTLTIARRDFIATVFTPIFLLFLFAPLIMASFGAVGGLGAATVAGSGDDRARIVVIVPSARTALFAKVDAQLRTAFREGEAPPKLLSIAPDGNPVIQAEAVFAAKAYDAVAVLFEPSTAPHILYGPTGTRSADYLTLLARTVRAAEQLGGTLPDPAVTKIPVRQKRATKGGRNRSAFLAAFGVFFLTLFLAGQVVGTMAEERNNKVIEILAAAVPLESVFLGKLLGMFGVAVLFVAFWGTVIGQIGALLPPGAQAAFGEMAPAVGVPVFAILFFAYFATAYLLLGSVFLGVGAQATTMREIQMLSLPVTIVQVGMFGLAAAATVHPGGALATFARIFPLSSPFAMAGLAASSPRLWPHLAAIAWQLVWVGIFVVIGARLFRRGVLQSGGGKRSRQSSN